MTGTTKTPIESIPEDLREIYSSDAIWDGELMVRFARQHDLPVEEWKTGHPFLQVIRYLIERIAATSPEREQKGVPHGR